MKLSMYTIGKNMGEQVIVPDNDLTEKLCQCILWDPSGADCLRHDVLYCCEWEQLKLYKELLKIKGISFAVTGDDSVIAAIPAAFTRNNQVLVLRQDQGLVRTFNVLLDLFYRYMNMEQQLADITGRNGTVQNLVDVITPLFDNELIVMNSNFKIAAISYESVTLLRESGLPQPSDSGLIPLELADYFRNDRIYKNVEKIKGPFYYEESIFSRRVLCVNVFVQNEYASRIVLCEVNHRIEPDDEQLLKLLARYVQIIYDKQGLDTSNLSPSALISVFWKLLYESRLKSGEAERALEEYHWSRHDRYLCFCIKLEGTSDANRSIPYYCAQLNQRFEQTFSLEFDHYIVGIVNLDKAGKTTERFLQHLSMMQKETNFRLGYSEEFFDILQLKTYYHQAEIALNIGMRENRSIWRHGFSSYYFSYVRDQLTEDIPAELHIPQELKRLAQYDENNNTAYVPTLQTYLDNRMNAVKTAEMLYIHRATMVYRLKRIQEIAGIDWEDDNIIFRLYMTFKLFETDSLVEN